MKGAAAVWGACLAVACSLPALTSVRAQADTSYAEGAPIPAQRSAAPSATPTRD